VSRYPIKKWVAAVPIGIGLYQQGLIYLGKLVRTVGVVPACRGPCYPVG
jgi:hypothetical protein